MRQSKLLLVIVVVLLVLAKCSGSNSDKMKCKSCDALRALQQDGGGAAQNKEKKTVAQANTNLKLQHKDEKTKSPGRTFKNLKAKEFVDANETTYVNVYLSNAHLKQNCRRQHGLRNTKERRKGHFHSLGNADHKNRAGASGYNQVKDIALQIDYIEFHHKAGGKYTVQFSQPEANFADINDESPKKIGLGNLPTGTYTKATVYFRPLGSARENDQSLDIDQQPKMDAAVDRQFINETYPDSDFIDNNRHFTLSSNRHYSFYLETDILDGLGRTANGLRFQPNKGYIQRIEVIEPELVQMRQNQVAFRIDRNADPDAVLAMINRLNIAPLRIVPGPNIVQAYVDTDVSLFDTFGSLLTEPTVKAVDFNYLIQPSAFTDEPEYLKQKSALDAMELPAAWALESGGGVKVAVLDTGIDPTNSDVAGALVDWIDPLTGDASASDSNGHGTEIASIIAGRWNGAGIAGVNAAANIIGVRALNGVGHGDYISLAMAMMSAVAKDAKILNLSLGGYMDSPILADTVRGLEESGYILVAAAGNDGTSLPVFPAAYASVISVAATGDQATLTKFSNYGETIDIAAPGNLITTTGINGKTVQRSGTSYAAAYATGIISLVLSTNPSISSTSLVELIRLNSDYAARGHQPQDAGAGRINAFRLLRALKGVAYNDLALVEIWPVRRAVVANQVSNIRVIVENRGTVPSSPTTVDLKPEDKPPIVTNIPQILPGERFEVLVAYTPGASVDGVKSIRGNLNYLDAYSDNNELVVQPSVVSSMPNDIIFGELQAIVMESEADKVRLKFSQAVLNNASIDYTGMTFNLYEIIGGVEQFIQSQPLTQIRSGEEKYIHFFAEKPFANEVEKQATYVVRGILSDAIQTNNWQAKTVKINRNDGGALTALHKERVHIGISESVIRYYLPKISFPDPLLQELTRQLGNIRSGACDEDGDDCSGGDPYFNLVDPVFGICGSSGSLGISCVPVSNMHFWEINDGRVDKPGVDALYLLYDYYRNYGVPNAWQRSYLMWTGANSINSHAKQVGAMKGIKAHYQAGEKDVAYRLLGRVIHLIQDQSMPAHAHGQEHATNDDSLEDWEGKGEADGWNWWNGNGYQGADRALGFFNTHYRSKPGSNFPGLLTVPYYLFDRSPAIDAHNPTAFPLFYLIQFTNMRAGWFADDENDGRDYTANWHNLPRAFEKLSGYDYLRSKRRLEDNDQGFLRYYFKIVCYVLLLTAVMLVCVLRFIPWIGPALCLLSALVAYQYHKEICETILDKIVAIPDDNDDDKDLSNIRDNTLPVAYIATATTYCHFFELVGQLSDGSCPRALTSDQDPMQRSIGGGVIGLSGTVRVTNNGIHKILTANGTFMFDQFSTQGATYNVSVTQQPAGQDCSVINGSGSVIDRDIRNIVIRCSTLGDATPPAPATNLSVASGQLPGTTPVDPPICANFLSWQNPVDADFFGVLIVRNESHPPFDKNDGTMIYNGDIPADNNQVPEGNFSFPNTFNDRQVLSNKTYYYAIIARDTANPMNYAAPATGSVTTVSGCDTGPSSGPVGGCFIATASFGEGHQLQTLRLFRDKVLMQSTWGITFVNWYYRVSPPIADLIRNSGFLRATTRALIQPVATLSAFAVGRARAFDYAYLMSFIILGVGMSRWRRHIGRS